MEEFWWEGSDGVRSSVVSMLPNCFGPFPVGRGTNSGVSTGRVIKWKLPQRG